MLDIEKKLEQIRRLVGKTVVFRIGMRKPKKYDILSMRVCYDDLEGDELVLSEEDKTKPDYIR